MHPHIQMMHMGLQEVTDLVVNVSRLSDYSQMHRDSLQPGMAPPSPTFASRLSSMLLAMSDPRSVLVKLTDRLHNMQTLAALPADKQQRIAQVHSFFQHMQFGQEIFRKIQCWICCKDNASCFPQLQSICLETSDMA